MDYSEYLGLEKILSAQKPRSNPEEHDEHLFIVIHQTYELWFKQLIHEFDYLNSNLQEIAIYKSHATLKRILTILKTLVSQVDILETMTPLSFRSFRSRLEASSGFQSRQFRELEMILGKKSKAMLTQHPALKNRFESKTTWDYFLNFIHSQGFAIPSKELQRDVTLSVTESPELQKALLEIYRENSLILQLCERFLDLDEGLQEWRYRHVKMVERTIGAKPGTGGSPGVPYLRGTITPMFPDLWAIRSQI